MEKPRIEIRLVKKWPTDDIVTLYKAAGWWKDSWNSKGIPRLIQKSYVFAVAIDTLSGKAVGMGRVLSDGVSDAYIQDLVVLPDYQGYGVGKQLVDVLLKHCRLKGIQWVGLVAEPGRKGFYTHLGFKHKKDYEFMLFQAE